MSKAKEILKMVNESNSSKKARLSLSGVQENVRSADSIPYLSLINLVKVLKLDKNSELHVYDTLYVKPFLYHVDEDPQYDLKGTIKGKGRSVTDIDKLGNGGYAIRTVSYVFSTKKLNVDIIGPGVKIKVKELLHENPFHSNNGAGNDSERLIAGKRKGRGRGDKSGKVVI